VERKLCLEADADRAALAHHPAAEAACDRPEDDRELVHAGRDDAVSEEVRDGAENSAGEAAADGEGDDDRVRLPEQMLGVLLDDVGIHVLHLSSTYIGRSGLLL
jgi:hypothetical protein